MKSAAAASAVSNSPEPLCLGRSCMCCSSCSTTSPDATICCARTDSLAQSILDARGRHRYKAASTCTVHMCSTYCKTPTQDLQLRKVRKQPAKIPTPCKAWNQLILCMTAQKSLAHMLSAETPSLYTTHSITIPSTTPADDKAVEKGLQSSSAS